MSNFLKEQIDAMQDVVFAGMRGGMAVERVRTDAIISAYDKAIKDPNTKIPSYLMAAIEAARIPNVGASPFAERRMQPRDDDMTTHGTPLKAGQ